MLGRFDEALFGTCGRAGFSVSLTAEPVTDEAIDLLGKDCADLQENVSVSNGVISGTLHYVTGYTGFSGNAELQEGNYVALKFSGAADRVRVKMDPSYAGGNWTTLDPDRINIFRVHDNAQKILVEQKVGTEITTSEYSLNFELEPAVNG